MNKKMRARKRRQARRVALTLVLMLTVALVSIGGTIAWLTATSGTVTNTFTVGNVVITLDEADVYEKGETGTTAENLGKKVEGADRKTTGGNVYQVIPGNTYDKDPKVTVVKNSEKCFLFVKFVETNSPASYYDYTSTLTTANGWTQGTGTIPSNVWYRIVPASANDTSWDLLSGNTITVNSTKVTKDNMAAAATAKLEWTAYACQYANMTGDTDAAKAASAWDILNG